jgi:glycosyltransferase involved in cell wall biosynthesis
VRIVNDVDVSVVVSARDAEATIGATLDGLLEQRDAPPFEVIVVDNGSRDATPEIVRDHPLGPRTILRERGAGPGVARNDGAAAARGRVLAFTNADCAPSPRWIAEGAVAARSADLVQGLVLPTPGSDVGPYDRTLAVTSEYGLYETANLFVQRDWFDRVGGFTDWVAFDDGRARRVKVPDRPFGEDAWFAWRARRLGARTTFSREALVHHAVFPGDVRTFIAEQVRVRHFPALLARIPELRRVFAWRRFFLNRRTAAFDVALLGVVASAVARTPLPLAAVAPYLVLLRREVKRYRLDPADAVGYGLAVCARDAVGCVALVRGSVEARSPLL